MLNVKNSEEKGNRKIECSWDRVVAVKLKSAILLFVLVTRETLVGLPVMETRCSWATLHQHNTLYN